MWSQLSLVRTVCIHYNLRGRKFVHFLILYIYIYSIASGDIGKNDGKSCGEERSKSSVRKLILPWDVIVQRIDHFQIT